MVPARRARPPFMAAVALVTCLLVGPATASPSRGQPAPGVAELELASAAVMTAGDALYRYEALGLGCDGGLYGGSVADDGERLVMAADQLVPGVAVSGFVSLPTSASATVTATLYARTVGTPAVTLHARWPAVGGSARATVTGPAGGRPLNGTTTAP